MTLADWLTETRIARGETIAQVAAACRVSEGTVYRWLAGRQPAQLRCGRIATWGGVTIPEVLAMRETPGKGA